MSNFFGGGDGGCLFRLGEEDTDLMGEADLLAGDGDSEGVVFFLLDFLYVSRSPSLEIGLLLSDIDLVLVFFFFFFFFLRLFSSSLEESESESLSRLFLLLLSTSLSLLLLLTLFFFLLFFAFFFP